MRLSDGHGPAEDSPASMDASPGRFELQIPGVARYLVEQGRTITVEPVPGSDAAAVRLFLLGSAIGALLHQRGVLPLHGAALRSSEGYVVIVGVSGAGKSSLAAALRKRGWPLASDDISAVRLVDGRPCLFPGYPESKVWPDVLTGLGDDPDEFTRVRASIEKRRVPVANFCDEVGPIATVIALTTGNVEQPAFTELSSGSQMVVLKRNIYRAGLSVSLGAHGDHFATIAELANQTRMWHLKRPLLGLPPNELAELLETHLVGQGVHL